MVKKKSKEASIMELYEEYLTDDLIENSIREKNDGDDCGLDDPLNDHMCPIERMDHITIAKYLNKYLLLEDLDYSKKQVTHGELKRFNSPYVVRVDNRFAEQNPERVSRGEILVVMDSKGELKSYINPEHIKEFIQSEDSRKVMKAFFKRGIEDLEKLQEYWYKSVVIKHELETNQNFLNLLMETNKVKNINKIKKFMNVMKQVELENASSEAAVVIDAAQELIDAFKEEVGPCEEVERSDFDSRSMVFDQQTIQEMTQCKNYYKNNESVEYIVTNDEGVKSFDGEIMEQRIIYVRTNYKMMLESVKEGVSTLAESLNGNNKNADELRVGANELKRRMLVLENIKKGEDNK